MWCRERKPNEHSEKYSIGDCCVHCTASFILLSLTDQVGRYSINARQYPKNNGQIPTRYTIRSRLMFPYIPSDPSADLIYQNLPERAHLFIPLCSQVKVLAIGQ